MVGYIHRERECVCVCEWERESRDLIIVALYAKQEQQRKNTYR